MKKTYIAPEMEAAFMSECEPLVESFNFKSGTVSGDATLVKEENNAWDIWGNSAE